MAARSDSSLRVRGAELMSEELGVFESMAVVMWSNLGWNGLEASLIGKLLKENTRD